MNNIIWISVLCILEIISFYYLKRFSLDKSNKSYNGGHLWYLIISMICYMIMPLFIYMAIIDNTLYYTNISWNVLSSIYGTLIGVYLFEEKFVGSDLIGIILCTIGIVLLSK